MVENTVLFVRLGLRLDSILCLVVKIENHKNQRLNLTIAMRFLDSFKPLGPFLIRHDSSSNSTIIHVWFAKFITLEARDYLRDLSRTITPATILISGWILHRCPFYPSIFAIVFSHLCLQQLMRSKWVHPFPAINAQLILEFVSSPISSMHPTFNSNMQYW